MLTKEQIVAFWDWHECNCKFAFDSPTSFEVCNQAIAAIDLAAENERLKAELVEYAETFSEQNNALSDHIIANARLKAKLDAVSAAVEEWLEISEWVEYDKLENILAIIDKDGE